MFRLTIFLYNIFNKKQQQTTHHVEMSCCICKNPNFPFCTYQGLESYFWEVQYVLKKLFQNLQPTLSLSLSFGGKAAPFSTFLYLKGGQSISFYIHSCQLSPSRYKEAGHDGMDLKGDISMVDQATLCAILELLFVLASALKYKFSIGFSKLIMQAKLEVNKHQYIEEMLHNPLELSAYIKTTILITQKYCLNLMNYIRVVHGVHYIEMHNITH